MDCRWPVDTFWLAPHRPLFLLAGLWALVAPTVWLLPGGIVADPVGWHLHELMFGMGGAAVGGYLLTSLPAWTGERASPGVIISLSALWVAARLAFALAEFVPPIILLTAALAYFAFLAGFMLWSLARARRWTKAWVVGAIVAVAAADFMLLADLPLHDVNRPIAGVLVFALMISLIGGRAVPAFTRHWFNRSATSPRLCDNGTLAGLSVAGLVVAGLLIVAGESENAGACLTLSGVLQLARMAGWRSLHVVRYPALILLHLAWLWLPIGLLLTGFALKRPDLMAPTAALHALTMGAMGTMSLAIMARAAMQRHDGRLLLSPTLGIAFTLVWISALVRISADLPSLEVFAPMHVAAIAWMSGWLLFLAAHLAALRRPVPWPVLSARTATVQERTRVA